MHVSVSVHNHVHNSFKFKMISFVAVEIYTDLQKKKKNYNCRLINPDMKVHMGTVEKYWNFNWDRCNQLKNFAFPSEEQKGNL